MYLCPKDIPCSPQPLTPLLTSSFTHIQASFYRAPGQTNGLQDDGGAPCALGRPWRSQAADAAAQPHP